MTTCAGLGEDVSDNTPTVENFYDGFLAASQPPTASPNFAKGKLTRVSSSVSDTRYTQFDSLGRLTESIQRTPFGTEAVESATPRVSKYAYNFAGALIEETYPSTRVVRYEYESDGDLSRIWGKKDANAPERTYANSFSYTPDGKIERLKLGNNRWEWAKFNERNQVTELNLGAGVTDASLWKLTYHYGELNADGRTVDAAKNTGNIAMQTVSFAGLTEPFVQTYRYDSLYRVTEARETNGPATNASQNWKETFSYDRFGNRTTFTKFTGTTQLALDNKTFPSIDPNTNRFNPNQGYGYDKNGNLISDAEGRSFVFNGENKQAQIIKDGKLVGEYDYNGEGQRVRKRTYDANGFLRDTTVFIYSAGKLVAEYTTAAPPTNPTTRYTATDMLGSPRVITDSQGNVISRRDFKPFGEEITNNTGERAPAAKYGTADNLRQKFTTYQRDEETGLDFAEARMYENRHGRFTAVDPLLASGKSANPQTFNRFVYVLNNPLRFNDPHGMIPVETVIDVVSLAASAWDFLRDPSFKTAAFLIWDIAATVIPYAPGSYVVKGINYGKKGLDALRRGAAPITREAAEWAVKVGREGYRGLRSQGIVGRLANNLEKYVNNDYIKKGYALLSQGDESTRRLLGMQKTAKAADFVGVTKSGTFIVGEAKGYQEIATGVEQLTNTMRALYSKVSQQGSQFRAGAEIVIEGTAETFLEKNLLDFSLSGSQLMKQVDGKLVPVTIEVLSNNGRRVANIPVQVRFVQ
ncbi:MAG: hypothetical protein IPN69_16390 [Acidobacteria bacterium]|nr:hypothetical protein [Acidobacteriota bacterium]